MIGITSISGESFIINCDLIYKIEEKPDTIITLIDGKTIRCRETAEDVVEKIVEFKRSIFTVFLGEM
ncbi:MAG: flagellar FlbD family protein [Gudongella sp.]|jgi:flagellar protein FlbD|nr:flagellar FlbD family protein [Gudongella sp.]